MMALRAATDSFVGVDTTTPAAAVVTPLAGLKYAAIDFGGIVADVLSPKSEDDADKQSVISLSFKSRRVKSTRL